MEDQNANGIDDSIDQERALTELERDRLKWIIRRRMAVCSFIALIVCGIYYALIGVFISMDQAKTMAEFNSIVVSIIGALVSLLLGYYGTSYLFDKDKLAQR